MDRITIRLPDRQLKDVEQLVDHGRYPNRSEVIRAAIRQLAQNANTSE